jgi:hypothetical protein
VGLQEAILLVEVVRRLEVILQDQVEHQVLVVVPDLLEPLPDRHQEETRIEDPAKAGKNI